MHVVSSSQLNDLPQETLFLGNFWMPIKIGFAFFLNFHCFYFSLFVLDQFKTHSKVVGVVQRTPSEPYLDSPLLTFLVVFFRKGKIDMEALV